MKKNNIEDCIDQISVNVLKDIMKKYDLETNIEFFDWNNIRTDKDVREFMKWFIYEEYAYINPIKDAIQKQFNK